jgi:hypothetical protein
MSPSKSLRQKYVRQNDYLPIFLFGFPGFSKESGKFKHKDSEMQAIIRENLNKKAFFLLFGFRRFYV